ncbi:hypothetical protein DMUE_0424 [Dictyocoela muelleri]|nr:hypothetical protein DMUE_0424 [Dictyocoela muelleri]
MTSPISLFLPTTKNYVNKLTKIRRKNNIIFERDDIPISAKFTFLNKKFLLHDSCIENSNRILIFTTDTHLLYLENSEVWYCDGTFKSCPRDFEQVYTIMGRIKGCNLPLVYIIMKNKSKNAYLDAFAYISTNIKNKPKFITIDL